MSGRKRRGAETRDQPVTEKVKCGGCGTKFTMTGGSLAEACPICKFEVVNPSAKEEVGIPDGEKKDKPKLDALEKKNCPDYVHPQFVVVDPDSLRSQICSDDDIISAIKAVRDRNVHPRIYHVGSEVVPRIRLMS